MTEATITVGTIAIARTATGNVAISNPHEPSALHVQKADVPDLVRAVEALALSLPASELMRIQFEGPDDGGRGPLKIADVETLLQYGQVLADPARSDLERYAGDLVCRAAVELREYRRELEVPKEDDATSRPPEDSDAIKRALAVGEAYDLPRLAELATNRHRVEPLSTENLYALLRAQEIMMGDLAAVYAALRNPRRMGCAWCADAGHPKDDMTRDESRAHAFECQWSPIVNRVRQLEAATRHDVDDATRDRVSKALDANKHALHADQITAVINAVRGT